MNRGRRRCSSADSRGTVNSEKVLVLQKHRGTFIWEHAPAGTPSRQAPKHASPARQYVERSQSPMHVGSVSVIPEESVVGSVSARAPSVISASDLDKYHSWAPDDARDSAEADENHHDRGPGFVARWLDTMAKSIPSPVLALLRKHIIKKGIDATALEDALDNFRFESFGIDGFTPVHMSCMRKGWYLDHPRASDAEASDTEEAQAEYEQAYSLEESAPDDNYSPPSPAAAELVAKVLQHLSGWAGFGQQAALAELKAVLPESVCGDVGMALAQLSGAKAHQSSGLVQLTGAKAQRPPALPRTTDGKAEKPDPNLSSAFYRIVAEERNEV